MNHFRRLNKKVNQFRKVFIVFILFGLATLFIYANFGASSHTSLSQNALIKLETALDLEKIRDNPVGNFMLTSDIELDSEFTPINSFEGTLDGNGHVISGLTITASADQPSVAFILENNGLIEKIGFVEVDIKGSSDAQSHWAGGMVAYNNGIIQRSFVTGSISGGYRSAGIAVHNSGKISNAYSVANVEAEMESGSLVAVSESGSVLKSSYAVPVVHSKANNTAGISAYAYTDAIIKDNALLAGTITNSHNDNIARITGRLNGNPIFQNNVASENATVQEEVVTGGVYDNKQGLTVGDRELSSQFIYEEVLDWDFDSIWEMNEVLDRPQLKDFSKKTIDINSASDLEKIREKPTGDFILTSNIELDSEFIPINSFEGTLNGNGHVISGLTITASVDQPSVAFILDNNGLIENIGFIDVAITGSSDAQSHWASGMVATNNGMIKESFVTGFINGGFRSAGIAAHNYGNIKNSYSLVNVKAEMESGSLVAVSESGSVIETSYAVPEVHSEKNNTAGISAYANTGATIKNNALLAGTITNNGKKNIARITGRLMEVMEDPTLQNNVASKDVLVQGHLIEGDINNGGDPNNKEGLSVENKKLVSQSFYEQQLGWDFFDVWTVDTPTGLPTLQSFRDNPMLDKFTFTSIVLNDNISELSEGITHRQLDFIDYNGNLQKSNIIDVDLNLTQNKIIVGTKDDVIPPTNENGDYIRKENDEGSDEIRATVPVQASTTKDMGKNVIAGVNGEFYTPAGPEGNMIKDGSSVINGVRVPGADEKNYPFHGFFGIRNDGAAVIGDYGDDWEREKDSLFQASGGQFWVVKDGNVQDFHESVISDTNHVDYDQETYYRHKDRHPRTAVGIRKDGSVFFVVVDGRDAKGSTGVYIEELGYFMKELGAEQALNMDGGGSSTAVIFNNETEEYQIKNTPINNIDGVRTPGFPRSIFSSLLILVDE